MPRRHLTRPVGYRVQVEDEAGVAAQGQPHPVPRQEFSHPATVGCSDPSQFAWQSLGPQLTAVVLSQALLLFPQVNEQVALFLQSTTRPLHDLAPSQMTSQAYLLAHVSTRFVQESFPPQLTLHGIPAGQVTGVSEQASFVEQSKVQTPPLQSLQRHGFTDAGGGNGSGQAAWPALPPRFAPASEPLPPPVFTLPPALMTLPPALTLPPVMMTVPPVPALPAELLAPPVLTLPPALTPPVLLALPPSGS